MDIVNKYANNDSNILELQLTSNALFNNSFSLTEMDSSTVPAVEIGSKAEVGGAYYQAEAEEAISTTDPVTSGAVADGTVYICLVPNIATLTVAPAFTATAPTWSDAKQGYYGTGNSVNNKYVGGCVKAAAAYTEKFVYSGKDSDIYLRGRVLKTGNVPTFGFMADGTPLYSTTVHCFTTGSTFNAVGTHGISNALTNHRIYSVSCRSREAVGTLDAYGFPVNSDGEDNGVAGVEYNDTTMTIILNATTSGVNYDVFVVYF